jgi:hypothetical protein
MARRFTCGCEESDVSAMWDIVDTVGAEDQPGIVSLGRYDMVQFTPRTGRGMYTMNNYMSARYLFADNPTELYFGFAVRFTSLAVATDGIIYATTDNPGVYTNYVALMVNTDGAISLYRGAGLEIARSQAAVFVVDNWHYVEWWLKPLNTNGRSIVKVDGTIPANMNFTGDTTNDLELINSFRLQGHAASTGYITAFDDIVVNDTSGSVNNSWSGQVRLLPIRPKAAGNYSQWTRGGVDLGSDAAQMRNGSFNFSMLQTPNPDYKVTADVEVPDLATGVTIKNICVNAKARLTSGSGFIAPMVRANGVDSISADRALGSNWKYFQQAWDKNPEDDAPWAEADLANLEIGVSS